MRKMYAILLLGLSALSCVGCATNSVAPAPEAAKISAFPAAIVLPFTSTLENQFLVPVTINGEGPFSLMIDTGATTTAIYQRVSERLKLTTHPAEAITVHGLFAKEDRPVTRLDSVLVGSLEVRNLSVPILDNPNTRFNYDGVLGMDIMRDRILHIDADALTVNIISEQEFLSGKFDDWDKVNLIAYSDDPVTSELVYFYLRARNIPFITILDLGAGFSALNWDGARFPELVAAKRFILDEPGIVGAIDSVKPSFKALFQQLTADEYDWVDQEVFVIDLEPDALLGITQPGMFIAGANMLSGRSFVLNPASQLLLIKPTEFDLRRREAHSRSTGR